MTRSALSLRSALAAIVPAIALLIFAAGISAQEPAPAPATAPDPDKPFAQQMADMMAAECKQDNATKMPASIREDAGENASPALIAEMVAVGEQGICGCFIEAIRNEPDDRLRTNGIDHMEPVFKGCIANAMRPRMEKICTEAQRSGTDGSAPDCACLADAVAKMDDATLGEGANDLFDLLNSTRAIPDTAAALGDAARSCVAKR
jgi:hypothetical protein